MLKIDLSVLTRLQTFLARSASFPFKHDRVGNGALHFHLPLRLICNGFSRLSGCWWTWQLRICNLPNEHSPSLVASLSAGKGGLLYPLTTPPLMSTLVAGFTLLPALWLYESAGIPPVMSPNPTPGKLWAPLLPYWALVECTHSARAAVSAIKARRMVITHGKISADHMLTSRKSTDESRINLEANVKCKSVQRRICYTSGKIQDKPRRSRTE